MKILKGNYGECRFCDNMDAEHGLPSLKEKSWDLCLTDPPYNVKWDCNNTDTSKERIDSVICYEDNLESKEYFNKMIQWYNTNKWISICFSCGNSNFRDWIIYNDFNRIIWVDMAKQGGVKGANLTKWEYFLTINCKFKLNILFYDSRKERGEGWKHTCPKPKGLWFKIIKELNPNSIIDPFLGSGTTAQCCEEMGIPWLGYEIMEEYAPDIEKRIQLGIKSHKSYIKLKKHQSKLF